jgi:hypothetical protein
MCWRCACRPGERNATHMFSIYLCCYVTVKPHYA